MHTIVHTQGGEALFNRVNNSSPGKKESSVLSSSSSHLFIIDKHQHLHCTWPRRERGGRRRANEGKKRSEMVKSEKGPQQRLTLGHEETQQLFIPATKSSMPGWTGEARVCWRPGRRHSAELVTNKYSVLFGLLFTTHTLLWNILHVRWDFEKDPRWRRSSGLINN